MNVLLLYPAFDTPWPPPKPDRPPLGLFTIAAPLVAKGIEVTVLDERAIFNVFEQRLMEELAKEPVCVGISTMSVNHITNALRVSRIVKENSNSPVVWGGNQASLEPLSTLKHELIDYVVPHDGEEVFLELVEALDEGSDLSQIRGIGWKDEGEALLNPPALPGDIMAIPPIPFHLIDFDDYEVGSGIWQRAFDISPKEKVIPLETSRGCPFICSFCTESVRKKKWRTLTPERVLEDVKYHMEKTGIKNFCFVDDNLFGHVKRGEEIVELFAEQSLDVKWYTNIRPDFMAKADKSFVSDLHKAGCRHATFGAESGSDEILEDINKKSTLQNVFKTNLNLVGSDILPSFFCILGFPDETVADLKQTFSMMIKLQLDNPASVTPYALLIATPGTELAERCIGVSTKNLTLEDWVDIIDNQRNKRSSWILDETHDYIYSHEMFLKIILRLNKNITMMFPVYRFLLRVYSVGMKVGFSRHLDSLLKNAVLLRRTLLDLVGSAGKAFSGLFHSRKPVPNLQKNVNYPNNW